MPDSDIQVAIGADASALVAAVSQARAALAGLGPSAEALAKPFGDLNDRIKGGMAASEKSLRQLKTSMDGVVASFTKGLAGMALGTTSFAQAMHAVGQRILADMLKVVDGMVDHWLWGVTENVLTSTQGQAVLNALGLTQLAQEIAHDVQRTASKTTNAAAQTGALTAAQAAGLASDTAFSAAQRVINAQTAFSGAIAAISPVPFIGPFIAPGIAAEMAALASAAGGFDIPAGVNPLTQLHAREMVLPARLANPMRAMMDDYAAGRGAAETGAEAARGGDVQLHLHMGAGADGPSLQRWFDSHGDKLARALQIQTRRGVTFA